MSFIDIALSLAGIACIVGSVFLLRVLSRQPELASNVSRGDLYVNLSVAAVMGTFAAGIILLGYGVGLATK